MLKRSHAFATVLAVAALLLSACSPAGRTGEPGGSARGFASMPGQPPKIVSVDTDPALTSTGGFRNLPAGSGRVVVRVNAENADRVRFLLTPTGTDTTSLTRLLGEDTDGADGWSFAWSYPDSDILAHFIVEALGAGGTARIDFGVYHEQTRPAPGQGTIARDGLMVFEPNPGVLADLGRAAREVRGLPKYTRVVGWVDDSTVLALASSNPIAFDVRTGAYRALGKNAWWALLSPDRSLLAYRDERSVHVVKTSQKEWGQEVVTLPTGGEGQPRSVVCVWWSPDGSRWRRWGATTSPAGCDTPWAGCAMAITAT